MLTGSKPWNGDGGALNLKHWEAAGFSSSEALKNTPSQILNKPDA